MAKKEETTFYRFYSEIKAFLTKLMNSPIKAEPSKYLKDRDFTKTRLIKLLMNEGVLVRDEKILIPGKDDVKNVTYSVKYSLKVGMNGSNQDTFQNKLEKIHAKYFPERVEYEKNNKEAKKEEIDECDCGGATSCCSSGQFVQPIAPIQRRNRNKLSEQNIIKKMGKKIRFTEEQMKYIMECNGITPEMLEEDGATTCASVGAETTRGDVGYDAPAFNAKKNDKFWKDAMTHNKKGGVSCETLDEDWKSAAVGLGLGAASLLGGANGKMQAAPAPSSMPNKEVSMHAPVKFSERELASIFPYAYRDRYEKNPEIWKRNSINYEGYLPVEDPVHKKNKKLSIVGREAAKNGRNPWDAILRQYLDTQAGKTIAGQF